MVYGSLGYNRVLENDNEIAIYQVLPSFSLLLAPDWMFHILMSLPSGFNDPHQLTFGNIIGTGQRLYCTYIIMNVSGYAQ